MCSYGLYWRIDLLAVVLIYCTLYWRYSAKEDAWSESSAEFVYFLI